MQLKHSSSSRISMISKKHSNHSKQSPSTNSASSAALKSSGSQEGITTQISWEHESNDARLEGL